MWICIELFHNKYNIKNKFNTFNQARFIFEEMFKKDGSVLRNKQLGRVWNQDFTKIAMILLQTTCN